MKTDYAPGEHALLDMFTSNGLADRAFIDKALRLAAEAAGATVLDVVLHSFGDGAGVTGVAVLAESHLSIHTWPELDYAAVDIFLCGRCRVEAAIKELVEQFQPKSVNSRVYARTRPEG